MDLVEVCPPFDHADLTSHLAAHLLFEGLAVAALARQAEQPQVAHMPAARRPS
jgi:agmatinase